MNYLIQRGKVRGQVINVPDGLPELLSDITREVLRCQPTKECLCQFIIDYLHSVIVSREKARVAKSIIDRALRQVDEVISDMCICGITKEKSDQMAETMEICFKRFLEQRRCEMSKGKEAIKFDEEDILDQLIEKCKFSEEELKISRPLIDEAYNRFVQAYLNAVEEAEGTEALYQYFKNRELKRLEEEVRNKAATKIQASFRGYLVRRSLFMEACRLTFEPKIWPAYTQEELDLRDKAARIIQRFFQKYFGLRMLEPMGYEEMEDPCSMTSGVGIVPKPEDEVAIPTQISQEAIRAEQSIAKVETVESVETEVKQDIPPAEPVGISQEKVVESEKTAAPAMDAVSEPENKAEDEQTVEPEPELQADAVDDATNNADETTAGDDPPAEPPAEE